MTRQGTASGKDGSVRPGSGLSRRAFITGALGLTALSLAAGCQAPAPATQPQVATTPPVAAEAATPAPRAGGILTWAQSGPNDEMDYALGGGFPAQEIQSQIYDTLVAIDANQNVYPRLATRWTMEDDGKRYTFTLRDDVKFHDGATLDAAAVTASWGRVLDPATKSPAAFLYGPVDRIHAPDPRTVVALFKQPNPSFLLQAWRYSFSVTSPKALAALKAGEKITTPVGSGPFKYVGRSPDGVVTLERFADYAWGPSSAKNTKASYLQSVKFRAIAEAATRAVTLESGENLLVDELPAADYARLKGDARFRFLVAPRPGNAVGFFLNARKPPTDDRSVREALQFAVDRQAIVDKLFFGVGTVAVGPLAEGVPGRAAELEARYTFDPPRAQQALESAGWKVGASGIREKDGQKLSLLLATYRSPWDQIAEALQAQFRTVGIELVVQRMQRGPYLEFTRTLQHNLAETQGVNLDVGQLFSPFYHSKNIGQSNYAGLSDPKLDALLDRGSQQPPGPERQATYEAVQRAVMDQLVQLSVMGQSRVQAMSAKVNDYRLGPDALYGSPLSDVWLSA